MLVLTRKERESIVVGNNGEVKITVLRVKGNQIKIGIEAPSHIPVNREEIFFVIQEEKSSLEMA